MGNKQDWIEKVVLGKGNQVQAGVSNKLISIFMDTSKLIHKRITHPKRYRANYFYKLRLTILVKFILLEGIMEVMEFMELKMKDLLAIR